MATQVPRIQVTLKPDTYAIISRISDLTKGSKSRLIADLVDEVVPHLETMMAMLETASTVKVEHREKVAAEAQSLLDLMLPHAQQAHAAFDKMASVLASESDGKPPSSNTGVETPLSHCKISDQGETQ